MEHGARDEHFPRLKHPWVYAGYRGEGKGKDWAEKRFGWSVDFVERPKKPASKEVLMAWAAQWSREGVVVDWRKIMPPDGFVVLPRLWVVERSFAWICHNRRMSKDYERLCASSEAFVYSCHDSPHAEAVGSLMRLFHTVSEGLFSGIRLTRHLRA